MKQLTAITMLTLFVLKTYALPRPEEYPISTEVKGSTIKDAPVSSSEPIDSEIHTTLGLLQKSPTYYQDMFNIPIAALQAVGNFLSGSYITNNSSIRPIVLTKDAQSLLLKSSLVPQETDKLPLTKTHVDGSTVAVTQSDIKQQTKPGIVILRIPTMQDIINIPISTLQAVSHFLATNYGVPTNNATVTKESSTSGDVSAIKESQASSILKSSPVSEVLVEIPSQSTISDASSGVSTEAIQMSQQLLQTNPSYYQDIFNIPIGILQSVSNFLTNAYTNRNSTVAASTQKTITEISTPISSGSLKSLNLQVSEEAQSSSNSIDIAPVKNIQIFHEPVKEVSPNMGQLKKEDPNKALKK